MSKFLSTGETPPPFPSRENPAWMDLTQCMGEHVRGSQETAKYLVNTSITWCQLKKCYTTFKLETISRLKIDY